MTVAKCANPNCSMEFLRLGDGFTKLAGTSQRRSPAQANNRLFGAIVQFEGRVPIRQRVGAAVEPGQGHGAATVRVPQE